VGGTYSDQRIGQNSFLNFRQESKAAVSSHDVYLSSHLLDVTEE